MFSLNVFQQSANCHFANTWVYVMSRFLLDKVARELEVSLQLAQGTLQG